MFQKFDFMVGGAGTPAMQGSINWDHIHSKLLQLLKANSTFDSITDWISVSFYLFYTKYFIYL